MNEHDQRESPPHESGFEELEKVLHELGEKGKGLQREDKKALLASEAVLTGVRVVYRTRDDNKDHDTRLESWINMSGGREAAYASRYGEYDDWSEHVVDLTPKTNVMRKADIRGSWLQIRVTPNGNDTWRFRCEVTLYFSDGSFHSKSFPEPTTLDQGSRQANKPL
jgi:hypothetical protein